MPVRGRRLLRGRPRWVQIVVPTIAVAAVVAPPVTLQVTANDDPPPVTSNTVVSSAVVDEFNGRAGSAPNPQIWQHITGGGGFGNNELEVNTDSPANSSLDGHGHLVISVRRTGTPGHYSYTSARLASLSSIGPYLHAEARIKMAPGQGVWPAFWMIGGDANGTGWPVTGELDVAESVGKLPKAVFLTAHGFSANPETKPIAFHWFSPTAVPMRFDVTKGYHVYAMDVTPDSITWSIDHHLYKVLYRNNVHAPDVWSFNIPFHVMLTLSVGGTFAGVPRPSTHFPASMYVDYVRVTSTS